MGARLRRARPRAPFVTTEIDPETGALFARNPWNAALRLARRLRRSRRTPDRLDRRPPGVHRPQRHARETGGACGANATLQERRRRPRSLRRAADARSGCRRSGSVEIVFFLGQAASTEDARRLIARYRAADLDAVLADVDRFWNDVLGAVQVKTPDRSMDIMLNGWLLYQTLACRIWARAAFYQASGAYGFRDQLQDGMALASHAPGPDARASAARRRPAVRRGRRSALVAAAFRPRRAHADFGRPRLARLRGRALCRGHRRRRRSRRDRAVPRRTAAERRRARQLLPADDLRREPPALFEHCARGLDQSLASARTACR